MSMKKVETIVKALQKADFICINGERLPTECNCIVDIFNRNEPFVTFEWESEGIQNVRTFSHEAIQNATYFENKIIVENCLIELSSEIELTDREQNIVLATIRLWNVNKKDNFVPDYNLIDNPFQLTSDEMRKIRDLVQEVANK